MRKKTESTSSETKRLNKELPDGSWLAHSTADLRGITGQLCTEEVVELHTFSETVWQKGSISFLQKSTSMTLWTVSSMVLQSSQHSCTKENRIKTLSTSRENNFDKLSNSLKVLLTP